MLIRLQVSGFKNLADVDVRFGPLTCLAGPNAVGKSNLLDAILFLGALAEQPLQQAALGVRGAAGRAGDPRTIFRRAGGRWADRMTFTAEMLVPAAGTDELGQQATAGVTLVEYSLVLGWEEGAGPLREGRLRVLREELLPVAKSDAPKRLRFRTSAAWRRSLLKGGGRRSPLISCGTRQGSTFIARHQEGQGGRKFERPARDLLRTVLSSANAGEADTAFLTRLEMQGWRLLQLEPSALREPDDLSAPTMMTATGRHLPATLYALAHSSGRDPASVYAEVANRLATLVEDVHSVSVDRDESRRLLTLVVTGRDGVPHPARALSDGTLRFLALAVLQQAGTSERLLCLEEPENGIHPARVPAMVELLYGLATDPTRETGAGNPPRQVILTTHSPRVVAAMRDEDVLFCAAASQEMHGTRGPVLRLQCLENTWRARLEGSALVSRATLYTYLDPCSPPEDSGPPPPRAGVSRAPRVGERRELQLPGLLDGPTSGRGDG